MKLAVRSQDYKPNLNDEGTLLKELLQLMDGEHTSSEIAGLLLRKFPVRFASEGEAVRFVSSKIAKMGLRKRDS